MNLLEQMMKENKRITKEERKKSKLKESKLIEVPDEISVDNLRPEIDAMKEFAFDEDEYTDWLTVLDNYAEYLNCKPEDIYAIPEQEMHNTYMNLNKMMQLSDIDIGTADYAVQGTITDIPIIHSASEGAYTIYFDKKYLPKIKKLVNRGIQVGSYDNKDTITESKSLKGKRRLKEAPDMFGLPTDDELQKELDTEIQSIKDKYSNRAADIAKDRSYRKAQYVQDAFYKAYHLLPLSKQPITKKYYKQLQEYMRTLGIDAPNWEDDSALESLHGIFHNLTDFETVRLINKKLLQLIAKCREEILETQGEDALKAYDKICLYKYPRNIEAEIARA